MIKNNWNKQKSLNCYVRIFQKKCMKLVIKLKKEGYKRLTNAWGQKPWRKLWKKMTKKSLEWIVRTHEKDLFKTLSFQILIGRNWSSIDRKIDSIDRESIEHRSNQSNSNQNFNCNFDRSSNSFDQSKIWNFEIFEIQRKFYAETTQNNIFHEWNAWVWV